MNKMFLVYIWGMTPDENFEKRSVILYPSENDAIDHVEYGNQWLRKNGYLFPVTGYINRENMNAYTNPYDKEYSLNQDKSIPACGVSLLAVLNSK